MTITYRGTKGQAISASEYDATVLDLDTRPNGQVYPKTQNVGIKIDTVAPDYGWHDLSGNLLWDPSVGGAATAPTFEVYNGAVKALRFDVNDEAYINFHMPHDYAMGTEIHVHVHWSHNNIAVTTGSVTFIIDGTYAKGHNQAAFGVPISVNLTENASTTRYQHMITEAPFSAAAGAGGLIAQEDLEVDGILLLRVLCQANTMDNGALPFVHFVDIHYQSTGLPTKQKAPDFWT